MSTKVILTLTLLISTIFTATGDYNYVEQDLWKDVDGAAACGNGQRQSPINIVTAEAAGFTCVEKGITIVFKEENTSAKVADYDSAFKTSGDMATLYLRNGDEPEKKYNLLQFHVHAPSEHQINGENFDAEVHFVFLLDSAESGTTDTLAVVGVMLKSIEGESSKFLEEWNYSSNAGGSVNMNLLSIAEDLENKLDTYYHYMGSLTTPACNEIVNWFVMEKPVFMSPEQKKKLDSYYKDDINFADENGNNRDIQKLNGRTVTAANLSQCTGVTKIHKRMNFGFIKDRARSLKFFMRWFKFTNRLK